MSTQRFDLITASLAGAIDAWYNATIDGDTAIITLPDAPAIYLLHQPHEQVGVPGVIEGKFTVSYN